MPVEDDAEHVVRLPLLPVRGWKEVRDGGDVWRIAADEGADPDLVTGVEVAQLIHELEPLRPLSGRVGEVVDAREECQHAVAGIPEAGQRVVDVPGVHCDPVVARADALRYDQSFRN